MSRVARTNISFFHKTNVSYSQEEIIKKLKSLFFGILIAAVANLFSPSLVAEEGPPLLGPCNEIVSVYDTDGTELTCNLFASIHYSSETDIRFSDDDGFIEFVIIIRIEYRACFYLCEPSGSIV